ncbi:MAG: TonB-dependent receptor [Bacteroidota bacterium]|nr:TonB-dependent receptor [Bacteroidota bacterium]
MIKSKYKNSINGLLLFCILSFAGLTANAQQNMQGTVKDKDGYPIKGVIVKDEANNLMVTDEKGAFSIEAKGTYLTVSLDGYFVKKVLIDSQHSVIIKLEKDPNQQMVDVAYGKERKLGLTASVSSISGEVLQKTPVPTLSNALYGRLSGLSIMQGSGEPGYDSPSMLIRGKATYNDQSFPVFVDGFQASYFNQLSAAEIESVTLLKDAAALAQFGIRGANGAIWVTTKHGTAGKTRIGFQARTGLQAPIKLPKFLGSYDYATLYNEAMKNDYGVSNYYSQTALDAYKNHTNPTLYPDVNWYDEVVKKVTPTQDVALTFSGGGNNARYFVLLGYNHNSGLYKNTDKDEKVNSNADFQRYNFRSNVDVDITKAVSASVILNGILEDRIFPNFSGPTLWDNMAKYPPNIYPVKNPDGTWGGNAVFPDNPVASVLAKGYASTHDRTLMSTFSLNEKLDFITQGLSFSQTVSFSNWFRGNYNKTRDYARYQPYGTNINGRDTVLYTKYKDNTSFSIDEGTRNQWNRTNLEAALKYQRTFGKHEVSGLVMYHQDTYNVDGNNVPYAKQGIFGRINYGFDSRYFAEFGYAYNGSENFPKGKRFGFFPTLSAAWVLSNESFMKPVSFIDFFKLRASAGLLGNDNIGGGRFIYDQYFNSAGSAYTLGTGGGSGVTAINEGTLANSNVTWEKSTKYNVGFETKFLKKLEVTFDYFLEKRSNILTSRSGDIPSIIGVGVPMENIGKVTNRGVEVSAMFTDRVGKFEYFAGGSFFYAHNKIDYQNEVPRSESYLYRTGHSIGQPFGLQAIGFFNSQDEINNSPKQIFAPVQPGDIKYKDQNNDGVINENDEVAIGYNSDPEITYTFNVGAKYKGFDFEMFFQGETNRSVYLNGTYVWALVNNSKAVPVALGRWTDATKTTASYPRLTTMTNDNNYRRSTFWTKDGSFLRLRNVELGYTLPESLTNRLRIASARIYINGINLLTWDKLGDFNLDPETMSGYPALKSYNIGVSLNF